MQGKLDFANIATTSTATGSWVQILYLWEYKMIYGGWRGIDKTCATKNVVKYKWIVQMMKGISRVEEQRVKLVWLQRVVGCK